MTATETRMRYRKYGKKWRERHPRANMRGVLKCRYGITLEAFDAQVAQQNGHCAICGIIPDRVRLSVDHDHETGMIRGLLCRRCNMALWFVEQTGWVDRALAYLASPPFQEAKN